MVITYTAFKIRGFWVAYPVYPDGSKLRGRILDRYPVGPNRSTRSEADVDANDLNTTGFWTNEKES